MKNALIKVRDAIYSENGMKVVNVLFFLSMLSRSPFAIIAYIAWIVYLVFCFRHTESKAAKIIFGVFIGIAVILICINLFFWISGTNGGSAT